MLFLRGIFTDISPSLLSAPRGVYIRHRCRRRRRRCSLSTTGCRPLPTLSSCRARRVVTLSPSFARPRPPARGAGCTGGGSLVSPGRYISISADPFGGQRGVWQCSGPLLVPPRGSPAVQQRGGPPLSVWTTSPPFCSLGSPQRAPKGGPKVPFFPHSISVSFLILFDPKMTPNFVKIVPNMCLFSSPPFSSRCATKIRRFVVVLRQAAP